MRLFFILKKAIAPKPVNDPHYAVYPSFEVFLQTNQSVSAIVLLLHRNDDFNSACAFTSSIVLSFQKVLTRGVCIASGNFIEIVREIFSSYSPSMQRLNVEISTIFRFSFLALAVRERSWTVIFKLVYNSTLLCIFRKST